MSSQKSPNQTEQHRSGRLGVPRSFEAARAGSRSAWAIIGSLGPGIVTGSANVDPSLVITATVAGAAFQFSLLWVIVLCIPFLFTVFAVSARLGYETRRGLVDLLRLNYGRPVAVSCAVVVICINMAMIIADLMAVSEGLSIILLQKRSFFVAAIAFTVWYILIFGDYRKISRALLWFSLPLFLYVASAVMSHPDPSQLLVRTVIPRIRVGPDYMAAMVSLFGSLLTPYVLVWQTSSRREHAIIGGERPHEAESHAGTFATTVLSYSIVVAAAMVLHLPSAIDMTTRQAADALRPAVGSFGTILFAIGIVGAGMVALPVLVASMCYSISEAMGWRAGLSRHPWEAKRFYVLISGSLFVASLVNFFRINPVKALFFSQLLAGILTIPILFFILILSNDRGVMTTTNTRSQNFWLGAAIGALVASGGLLLVLNLFH